VITSYEHWLSVCPKLAELRACYGRLHADLTAKINEYEDILVRLGRVSRKERGHSGYNNTGSGN